MPSAKIFVLAGVNGAGKSSLGGNALQGSFYNPDAQTRALLEADSELSLEQANAQAWELGRLSLERALRRGDQFKFETTLGARTIAGMLKQGAQAGAEVHIWYAGLNSPELHIQRVRSRVAAGGHDIPEEKIRQRYVSSLSNLLDLMPYLASLSVFDNSAEGDPKAGKAPAPILILRMEAGRITGIAPLGEVPQWAKPVVMQAIKLQRA